MKDIIQWCLDLGVHVVSVYAFSIDNFKRPAAEVEDLMELATAKFVELLNVSGCSDGCGKEGKRGGRAEGRAGRLGCSVWILCLRALCVCLVLVRSTVA